MATPSCIMEDQTDEDFFDKLVDDEFRVDCSFAVSSQDTTNFGGSIKDKYVVASLASTSLGESENSTQVNREKLVVESLGSLDNSKLEKLKPEKGVQKVEETVSDVSLQCKAAVEPAESTADDLRSNDLESDFSFGRGHIPAQTSVKEVQWSSFHADVVDSDLGGFGSYSDFFTELDASGQTGEVHYDTSCSIPSQPRPAFVNGPKHELDATGIALDGSPPVAHDSSFIPDSDKDLVGRSIIPESHNAVVQNTNAWDENYQETQADGVEGSQPDGKLEYSSQYWENLYPGWWYDYNTGEWHQKDGSDVISSSTYAAHEHTNFQNALESAVPNDAASNGILDQGADLPSMPQTSTPVVQAVSQELTAGTISNWNGHPQDGHDVYPSNMYEVPSLPQTSTPVVQAVSQEYTEGTISNWNGHSQDGNGVYPSNMYFHPDYPGWYYDTNTQQWHQLDAQFDQSTQLVGNEFEQGYIQQDQHNDSTETVRSNFDRGYGQLSQSDGSPGNLFLDNTSTVPSKDIGLIENHNKQEQGNQLDQFVGHYYQNNKFPTSPQKAMLYSELGSISSSRNISSHHQSNGYVVSDGIMNDPAGNMKCYTDHHISYKNPEMVSHGKDNLSFISGIGESETSVQNLSVPPKNFGLDQQNITQDNQSYYSPGYYENQLPPTIFQTDRSYASYAATGVRDKAGRPPHALVTFGFGGKLIVMKLNDPFNINSAMERQDPAGGQLSVHSLMDVVADKSVLGIYGSGVHDYFNDLCQSSFPGPLVGGNVANKDVHKWVDDRVATCESYNVDYRKGEPLRVLLSLLKISCLHYGKLRSPFGAEATSQDNDGPESAVAKLFSSLRRNGTQLTEYGASYTQCLQTVPSEASIRSTALEVQKLLVAGRRLEALQLAQEGQLWGPALVLAGKLGEKYYVETVIQMAHRQFIYGSPLRTLCLLIAGQLADVFSTGSTTSPRQTGVMASARGMLDVWEENLSIVVANRTKGDEFVITHLGDCLWKETGEVTAAHACYLLAEANFETFSDSARLCLLGADHWKSARTFASPDAIQRTELYEYAKVLGNPQFILQPFQPYKLVYAHMLVEVGKVSESLRYCQAILKLLKNAGRTADVETLRTLTSTLEERLRTHQQSGYSSNLAPGKLVGKVLTSIDRSIHRIIGGSPLPPLPPHQNRAQTSETNVHAGVSKISNGPSSEGVTTLMPSASMEPISEWAGDSSRTSVPSRSISEPNFGRTPKQSQNAKTSVSDTQSKTATSNSSSPLGFFRTSIVDKLVGLVRPPQAKLGQKNKFYYDEKLKRWVEEGADIQAEAVELAPPPTVASFQINSSSENINNALRSPVTLPDGVPDSKSPPSLEYNSGIPPIPPSSNQFSGRGRYGVRSRYVDTFNKGGAVAATNTFHAPTIPAAKPGGTPAQFFIPTPSTEAPADQDSGAVDSDTNPVPITDNGVSVSSVSSSMHRYPSMDNIAPARRVNNGLPSGSDMLSSRQRAASWSGSYTEALRDGGTLGEGRPRIEALSSPSNPSASSPPSRFMPIPNSRSTSPTNNTFAEELQEVEL